MASDQSRGLRDLAAQHNFFIGTAVNTNAFASDETTYREVMKREFNVLVAENLMKFSALSPLPHTYNWEAADALVEFAEANGMKLRGHTLVWHQQLPGWLTGGTWTATEAKGLLERHIKTVVERYQGRIWAWDVVNEAVLDTGYRTDSFWYQHIGPDYISMAFRWAHEADPRANLYYNDYSAEDLNPKSQVVYDLVRNLQQASVPINGVGWQMHVAEGWRASAEHHANAERIRALGLELAITEMDVSLTIPAAPAQLDSQAVSYREAIEFALRSCVALLIWGFTDKYSWIPTFRPGSGEALPFDADYQPKPAFNALKEGLAEGDRTQVPERSA